MLSLFGFGPFLYGEHPHNHRYNEFEILTDVLEYSELPPPQRHRHPLRRPLPRAKYVACSASIPSIHVNYPVRKNVVGKALTDATSCDSRLGQNLSKRPGECSLRYSGPRS